MIRMRMPPRMARGRRLGKEKEMQEAFAQLMQILTTNQYVAQLLEDIRNKTRYALRPKGFE